ncbi:glucokinase regulatory protein [Biomphalaria pfeifferi]|uniref:Glucokinase regulatory protein n=1 Tax=Biomphalaria pfeifferi TaxID=112525 RepID=A0AAD8FM23_BIOPF|nr:glucokinase regulatory protein [Biomphalaria pfeifferi]
MEQPITEQSNPLSSNIDVASSEEIVQILYACDLEIFHGWKNSQGIKDKGLIEKIENLAKKISNVIEKPGGGIVISGCGTSGRIAFLTARTFNCYLKSKGKEECFQYIIAGDDKALFTSIELAEDDPVVGAEKLNQVCKEKASVVYIGVTCGLSAPFVAGQLDLCLSQPEKYTPVLIGFNPVELARNLDIEKWDKTFLQVAQNLEIAEKQQKAFILNPVIGPEPITGSSRMKSGTTTRILLEVLSLFAIQKDIKLSIEELMSMYESVCNCVYKQSHHLGSLIDLAGASLNSGGNIYYLGCEGFGLMAMIDASECPPTYGASFHDIRGFVNGGFSALNNNDGDLSNSGSQYQISVEDFEREILPAITSDDLVVLLGEDIFQRSSKSLLDLPCKKAYVSFQWDQTSTSSTCVEFGLAFSIALNAPLMDRISPDCKFLVIQLLEEVSLKWVVNSLSTGAHILKGKVCQNIMIDVKVSNSKLFHRAVGIVQNYSSLSHEESCHCLLKSIYDTDILTEEQTSAPVVSHINAASQKLMVVPVAILIAKLSCSIKSAKEMISCQPVLRKVLMNYVN